MDYELDEWRHAVRGMTELQHVAACGHTSRTGAVCPDCGDTLDRSDA